MVDTMMGSITSAKKSFVSTACALLLFAQACIVNASPDTERVAGFFNVAGIMRKQFEKMAAADDKRDPRVIEMVRRSLGYIKDEEITRGIADLFEKHLSAQDVVAFIQFMDTPGGKEMKKIFQTVSDMQDLKQMKLDLSASEQAAAVEFFETGAGSKVYRAMATSEFNALAKGFGELAICRYMASELPAGLLKMKDSGKCLMPLDMPAANG